MTTATLRMVASGDADTLLSGLLDVARHPAWAGDILSVEPDGDVSTWTLAFRGRTARWTQRTRSRAPELGINFEQVDGDFTTFSGSWEVQSRGPAACVVQYQVKYTTSVAHLAGAVDPVIGRVLARSACAVVEGIAGPVDVVEGVELLHDPR